MSFIMSDFCLCATIRLLSLQIILGGGGQTDIQCGQAGTKNSSSARKVYCEKYYRVQAQGFFRHLLLFVLL